MSLFDVIISISTAARTTACENKHDKIEAGYCESHYKYWSHCNYWWKIFGRNRKWMEKNCRLACGYCTLPPGKNE